MQRESRILNLNRFCYKICIHFLNMLTDCFLLILVYSQQTLVRIDYIYDATFFT